MLSEFIPSLVVASSGIFSIGSITITILLLISEEGKMKGISYAAGYTIAYMLIGLAVILFGFTADNSHSATPNPIWAIVFIVFGILLIFLGYRSWKKPKDEVDSKQPSRLFAALDKMSPLKAFATGLVVSVINFKNLALFLTAVSVVYMNSFDLILKLINVILVAIVFCIAVIIPVFITLIIPQKSTLFLQKIKQSLDAKSHSISIWMPLIFGLIFIINGLIKIFQL